MGKQRTFTDEIRRAILDAKAIGLSRYELSDRIKVSQASLSRFVNGRSGISSDVLDRIAKELGLRLVVGRPRKTRN